MTRKNIIEKIVNASHGWTEMNALQVTRLIFFEAQEINYKLDPTELSEMVGEILGILHGTIVDRWSYTNVGELRKKLEGLPDHMPVFQEMTNTNWKNVEFLFEKDIYLPYIPIFYASVSATRKGDKAFIIGCSY